MNSKKILIVDDSDFFLELGKSFLKKAGCSVLTAGSGPEALEIIDADRPDLILLDLYMPHMNGDECCRKIKSDPNSKDIPVIMALMKDRKEDIEKSHEAGCNDYVTKPVNKLELLKKIKKLIALVAREEERVPIYSRLTYSSGNKVYNGEAYFISRGGIFINGDHLLPVGSSLRLRFSISSTPDLVEVEGNVAWNTVGQKSIPEHVTQGMGITFVNISDESQSAIASYIDQGNYLV